MARAGALLLLLAAAALHGCAAQLTIEKAERKTDISKFFAYRKTAVVVRNDGTDPEDIVQLCELTALVDRASYMEAEASVGGADQRLKWRGAGSQLGFTCRDYLLPQPLPAGARLPIKVLSIFTHVMRPEPAVVAQRDPQRVVYHDSARLISPHRVATQTSEFNLGQQEHASGEKPTFTKVEPSKRSGTVVTYGPYSDSQPYLSENITIHYENNHPFAQVTSLEREIEVSHWGNVYFEERYTLRHAGAKVAGEWSRFDLMTRPQEFGRAGIPALTATLPASAHSLYYRDSIGNISSSETRYGLDRVSVHLQPRYPLFGGWSFTFVFGWSMPLSQLVTKDPKTGRHTLTATLGPAIHDVVVDELTVKVVLPEGASAPVGHADMPLEGEPQLGTKYTYLDVVGRPVVTMRARNLAPEINPPFKIEYSYSAAGLLQKPLLLMAAFAALFAAAIAAHRLGNGAGSSSLAAAASSGVQAVVKAHAS